jgi:hypothetical protein
MEGIVLELLDNIPYAAYQFNVGNPPVDFGVEDYEEFIIYHWRITNTQNPPPTSTGELSTLAISRNALAGIAIEIYVLHVEKPFTILAALSPSLLSFSHDPSLHMSGLINNLLQGFGWK